MTTCGHDHEDGAYVLGALSPEDRVAFERHLPGCPECAQSVRELAGLPGLLARVPVEILDPEKLPMPVPETLLPALVRRVRRSQRRRTWIAGGLVAAAATIAIGAVVVAPWATVTTTPASAAPTVAHSHGHRTPTTRAHDGAHHRRAGADDPRRRRADLGLALAHPGRLGHPPRPRVQLRAADRGLQRPVVVDVHDVRAHRPTAAPSGWPRGRQCPARR